MTDTPARKPQFTKRAPGPSDPVTRQELQRKAEAWAILCSQLDDYAIAGNQAGIRRCLNRLYLSVEVVRNREQINGFQPRTDPAAEAKAWERRVIGEDIETARDSEISKP